MIATIEHVYFFLFFLQVFDAWGKPQSRLAMGNIWWLGAYDECKEIDTARYCISQISMVNSSVSLLVEEQRMNEVTLKPTCIQTLSQMFVTASDQLNSGVK